MIGMTVLPSDRALERSYCLLFHASSTEPVGIEYNHGGFDVESPDRMDGDAQDRLDQLFGTVSNRRRRYVLTYLLVNGWTATVRELAEAMAAWENRVDLGAVTYKQRKRAYTSLVQIHLLQLHDGGYVDYDADRKAIELTPDGESLAGLLAETLAVDEPSRPVVGAEPGVRSWLSGLSHRLRPA